MTWACGSTAQQGKLPTPVFTHRGDRLRSADTRAWRKALAKSGITNVRWHDFGANNPGVNNWAAQNGLLIAEFVPLVVALFVREGWVHLAWAGLCLFTTFGIPILYWPVLA